LKSKNSDESMQFVRKDLPEDGKEESKVDGLCKKKKRRISFPAKGK